MPKAKILLVEDEPRVVIFAEDQLKHFGYEVVVAYDGREGLEKAQKEKPDLIVLDVMMPEMDGFEVCERLKSDPKTKNIPILMLTAKGDKKDVAKGLNIGANGYLAKPYSMLEFEARVKALLRDAKPSYPAERQNPFVFVLMPFAQEYQAIYKAIVKKTVEADGLSCLRADDFYEARRIMEDIRRGIREATYLIADLSGRNPNVFYEVGIAHAEGKLPILLTQSMDDVPPRLKVLRCIVYNDSLRGAKQLKVELAKVIQSLRQNSFVTSPLFESTDDQIDSQLCFALMPPTPSDDTVYEDIVEDATREIALNCINAQQVFSIHNVTDAILEKIYQARVIIADVSGRDPDVFYLTGVCHGLDKDVVLLARKSDDIPFDLRGRSHVIYSTESFAEGDKARDRLKQILNQILREKPLISDVKVEQTHVPTVGSSKSGVGNKQQAQEQSTNQTELRQKLEEYFNISELKTLCVNLGIDYENIPGGTKEAMVRELVLYFERNGRLSHLLQHCRQLRPNVEW